MVHSVSLVVRCNLALPVGGVHIDYTKVGTCANQCAYKEKLVSYQLKCLLDELAAVGQNGGSTRSSHLELH